jgi:hypothetical protein
MTKPPFSLKDYDGPTGAENIEFLDRAFWLDLGRHKYWIEAFETIDKRGDKAPLLELLKSKSDLPRDVRWYLADLLARHQLKKKRGAQATPAYDRTDVEAVLIWAIDDVRGLVKRGMSVADALEKVVESRGYKINVSDEDTIGDKFLRKLALAYKGNRGSTNRMKKRRP